MKLNEAFKIVEQLQSLAALLKPENGNLRWNYLQNWLKDNPEWEDEVNQYTTISSEQAMTELRQYLAGRVGASVSLLKMVIPVQVERQAKTTIETIQQLYRDRKELNEMKPKQIKAKKKKKKEKVK